MVMPAEDANVASAEAEQREKNKINDIWKLVSLQVTDTHMDITIE